MKILLVNARLPILFNRNGGIANDGWIHIVPRGELPNKEAGVVQVLDDQALDSIIANLNADKQRLGNRWPGLYGGEEHFIYDSDKSSEAFVWAKEFEKRDDGIWGRGDVTDVGEPALKNKRFKFTSFVTDPGVPGSIEKLGGNRVRILKIDTFGFTNMANGRHLLNPISNRNGEKNFRQRTDALADEPTNKKDKMKSVCTRLGLSADASEDAVLAEVNKLLNRATTAEAEVTPLKNRVTTIETENKTLLDEQCDALLDAHGVKEEKLRNRVKSAISVLKNREDRVAALLDFGHKPVEAGKGKTGAVILNRGTGKPPVTAQEPAEGNSEDLAREASTLVDEYKLLNRCTTEHATNVIRNKRPELFGLTARN